MRIVHAIPNVAEEASGPSYSVPALCGALAACNHQVRLHSVAPGPAEWRYPRVRHLVHPRLPVFPKLGFSPAMRQALILEARSATILHSHSLWMLPNVYPLRAIAGTTCPLVVSPRGTLSSSALARNRTAKAVLWVLGQGAVIHRAACLHATSTAERDDIRALGITRPIAVIPNGVDLPAVSIPPPGKPKRRLLFLGRVHAHKGLDLLLPAWSKLEPSFPDWELVIAGPDDGFGLEVDRLSAQLGTRRVRRIGAVHNEEKRETFAQADTFILPSRSENFGMVIAEALGYGIPVVATRGTPWQGLVDRGCGWWIEGSVSAIETTLHKAMALSPDQRKAMGHRGREWMLADFAWAGIAERMIQVYEWLRSGGTPPACVEVT